MHVQALLLATILAHRHQPVASHVALDPLHWAMCLVSYWNITMASETASKYGAFFVDFFQPTLAAASAVQSKFLPDSRIQWLLVKS